MLNYLPDFYFDSALYRHIDTRVKRTISSYLEAGNSIRFEVGESHEFPFDNAKFFQVTFDRDLQAVSEIVLKTDNSRGCWERIKDSYYCLEFETILSNRLVRERLNMKPAFNTSYSVNDSRNSNSQFRHFIGFMNGC